MALSGLGQGGGMNVDNNEWGFKANRLILDTAMTGYSEGKGPIELYYKSVGCYLLAHIVDLDTHKESFRVFRCERQGYLEKKLVLNPSYTAEEYTCVYDSIESTEGRTILHTEGIDWMEYVSSRV